ncbi:PR5-like receptor kinase [Hibiscus syriacus]|uniref:PR5-like receptor kinase n=1 Tax=Hibiscus syriacus TaxID=106335 RepID=A0A6A3AQV3_HIBSY|nr:rust resistance kinase Lr10-like [Hibiscus syriacus]KAE8706163.1 PR5-like receptor kinase [Hibiscus syriacus]
MPQLKAKLPWLGQLMAAFAFALVVFVFPGACLARHVNQDCGSVFCGSLNISYPFRLKTQPPHCGHRRYEVECDKNNRTTVVAREGKFSVEEIFYENYTMRVVDAGLDMDDCNSLPLSSVYYYSPYLDCEKPIQFYYDYNLSLMYVVNCTKPIESALYIPASRCRINSNVSSYFYFLDGRTPLSNFSQSCTLEVEVSIWVHNISGMSTLDIYNKLSEGVLLTWMTEYYFKENCISHKVSFQDVLYGSLYVLQSAVASVLCVGVTVGLITLRTLLGILCLVVLVTYKWRRSHLSADDKIEEFLQNHNLSPIRYSFKQIRKMTKKFKEKLGEGGYGSVFKGKLRSGHHVAVKLLGKSKGNGQDFINEVASIGRIHHANVAKLVGFCVEGSKQALVYDFMPNGSLDKIIFTEENKNALGWKKMLEIALGVARGIDYLHRGCDMQILHFDIKPHNILLDHNFNPKVSDFGLAKLYSVDESVVSLTSARGTIGYIAPELVYKNLGGISYKADVYSFGMLLMETVGRRKNVNAFADHTSQIYFPSWIYDRLDQGEDMELGDASDDEKVMVRKMLITAFWCIQLHSADRPSMSKVLRMLENEDELLEMPPKPFHELPLDTSSEVHGGESPNDEPTTSMDSITINSRSNVV